MPEDSVLRTDILEEGLSTAVTLRKHREQRKAAKASATDRPTSGKTPLKISLLSWRLVTMPRISAENFIILLSCSSLESQWISKLPYSQLKTPWGDLPMISQGKFSGDVCTGVIRVHEQESSASLKTKIRWWGGNIAFMSLLSLRDGGPQGVAVPPHLNDQSCGHCGQVVGATEEGMIPHDCKPSCLQPGGHRGGRGYPQQRPTPKTQARQPGATNQAPKNPVAVRSSLARKQTPPPPTTSQTPHMTSTKTPDQGRPELQAGEIPPLCAASGIRPPAKKTSSQLRR
ncbi:hypothetical protein HPB50_027678 [Hyalomma asiaticum]|nr:hypothetical protein HPB50_027678 [Hyalomma asiaticum]